MVDDGGLPVVMAIVRGAFGRHAWTMQLRHQSHSHKVGVLSLTLDALMFLIHMLLQCYMYSASDFMFLLSPVC